MKHLPKLRLPLLMTLLAAALLWQGCTGQKQLSVNPSRAVPDKAFRTFLQQNSYAEREYGKRMRPTAKGLVQTEMVCYEQGIASLEGIEMFPQLTALVCSDNPIRQLDLNGLPNLEKLYGIHMPLERLAIDSCHRLRSLELSHTQLSHLDLHPFPDLSYLFCIFSPLETLDLSPCPKMKSLYIRGTAIEEIDLTPCPEFFELHADDTPLRRLWVTDQQYDNDIKVWCSDSVQVRVVPWDRLAQLKRRATTLDEAEEVGITLDTMEAFYPSGMPLFGDSIPQAYMEAWKEFVIGMTRALREAGMDWQEPYRLWGRAYFAPDGSVDHYLYQWTGDNQPSNPWKAQFAAALEGYLAAFRFAYPMERRFAQCGSIRLVPAQ